MVLKRIPAASAAARGGVARVVGTLAALSLALWAGTAAAAEYSMIDAKQSMLHFRYTEMGVAIDGSFSRFTVKLNFDPARPESAHVSVDVPFTGIDAGSSEADSEVTGKDWLDTAHYPTAHFESTAIKSVSPGHYQLNGNLSIKGRTHAVSVPAAFTVKGGQGLLEGAFSINRGDFSIGEGEWADTSIIAAPIQVSFKVLAGVGN